MAGYNYALTFGMLAVVAWTYWRTRLTAPLAYLLWQFFSLVLGWTVFSRGMSGLMVAIVRTIDVTLFVWLVLALLSYSPAPAGAEGEERLPSPRA